MLPIQMSTPDEIARDVAARAAALRLQQNLTQAGLAARAGVSLGSLKRFERTGEIAFGSLVRVAVALSAEGVLADLFAPPAFTSIDDALARTQTRRRGRRS